ncbi:MAG: hypothetical protein MR782_00875, partial [Campylobacter sp.]|nr:hypothetical protein [Campylobacter sp.]
QNNNFTSWNSSFNKQEQANSRETFNLEFPAEIKIQSDIKTTKKLEINGIEYLEFPSSNVEINSAMNSALSQATAVSQATAYGYSVDSKGFMGADFNAAAGLPTEFKIHKSTLDELVANSYRTLGWENAVSTAKATFSNIDVANTIGQYFNVFSQIVDTSKKAFSTSELNALPAGYDFVGKENSLVGLKDFENMVVTHKFDASQMNELENLAKFMPGVMPRKLDFSPASMRTDNAMYGFAPDMSVYESGEEYSIESVFVSFLKAHDASALKGGGTELSGELSPAYSFGGVGVRLEQIFGEFESFWARIAKMLPKSEDAKEKAKEAFYRAQAIFNEAQIWDDKEQNHPSI